MKGGRRLGLSTLPPSVIRLSRQNVGASTSDNPMGLHGLVTGTALTYLTYLCLRIYLPIYLAVSVPVYIYVEIYVSTRH
jgi:hypothetical protein